MVAPDMDALFAGRIAVLGFGREGQAAWRYLRKRFPAKQLSLLAESHPDADVLDQISDHDQLLVGPLSEANLDSFNLLVRSPGISPYRQSLKKAVASGAHIITPSTLWFAEHRGEKTICVTGTKGKSTTSALLAHMLRASGLRVCLAGNIGLPLMDCQDQDVDWWVIELSSYQLADLQAKPDISVILNLTSEHLDWHGGEERYREDKLRLAMLAAGGPVLANAADPVLRDALAARSNTSWFNSDSAIHATAGGLFDGNSSLVQNLPEGLPGFHNLANAAAALSVLRLAGVDLAAGIASMDSFTSLPHRLQILGERDKVLFVNDSISSTPVATVAALEAFSGRDITLIIGGFERGIDWGPYMETVSKHLPLAVIAIPDNGNRIVRQMESLDIIPEKGLHQSDNLSDAVELARGLTPQGGLVLLSPGAPSFPQFRDYRERGQRFAGYCGFACNEQELLAVELNKAAGQG